MEEHEYSPGYYYTLKLAAEPRFPEASPIDFKGHFIFHDKVANIFIFKKADESGGLTLNLINGDCIAESQLEKNKEMKLIDLLESKNDFQKEWERFRSRKLENEVEKPEVQQEQPKVEEEENGESSSGKGPEIIEAEKAEDEDVVNDPNKENQILNDLSDRKLDAEGEQPQVEKNQNGQSSSKKEPKISDQTTVEWEQSDIVIRREIRVSSPSFKQMHILQEVKKVLEKYGRQQE